LGGLQVDGLEASALGSRKGRAVLRRLAAAEGRPVAVDDLAAAVWGEQLPARTNDQLSVLVSRLRGVLGSDRLRREDAGYRLVADWFDVVHLRTRVDEVGERLRRDETTAAHAAAQAALAELRGPFLPEEQGPWVQPYRAAADVLTARLRRLAAEAAVAAGDPEAALGPARELVDRDPYDETALRALMRAEVAAGRPAAALRAYDSARARLATDLGVEPDQETRAVHLAVLRGEPAVPGSRARAPLVGREGQLHELDAALDGVTRGGAEVVVIEAEAGMGKTALLRSWTAAAAGRALVVRGRADPLGRDLPLQPVLDGLATLVRGRGPRAVEALLGAQAPVLEPLLGRATAESSAEISAVTDEQSARVTLFAALAAVLDRARDTHPLLLVVDDLHLAGPGTAQFLAFLLPRLSRLLVLVARRPDPGPDLPDARRVRLGPLTASDAAALVGAARAPALHARSGGHPLFLVELARSEDTDLPLSVVAAVTERVDRLGRDAEVLRLTAMLGPGGDVDLLAAVADRPVPVVLDALERGGRAGLLQADGAPLAFTHEIVREAVERGVPAGRRVTVHRTAARVLADRADADPLAVAHHARLGGNAPLAAQALVTAARRAAERAQPEEAERLLDAALALHDSPAARLARGRLRLARLDLAAAAEDARRARDEGAGAAPLELAGWIAYYARDYDSAQRYADEGAARTDQAAVRASCLALSGRLRHTRGDLERAGARLEQAVALAPPPVRGVALVWQAQLLVHRGRPAEGIEAARRGLVDPRLAHPFAPLHGRFSLVVGLGLATRWADAMAAADDLDRMTARLADRRFPAVAANIRGWLLRGAGLTARAADLHVAASECELDAAFLEPHFAALLDLAEDQLAAEDTAAAATALDRCAGILDWTGSMAWRHQQRYRLLGGRLALRDGGHAAAAAAAQQVLDTTRHRGDPRYAGRAEVLAATAAARGGSAPPDGDLMALAARFLPLAGPDGWRELAELAGAAGCTPLFRCAEEHAAVVVTAARGWADDDARAVPGAVRDQLERWRP
jgi:DNA-binding SARP family transcriptional activator